MPNLREHEQDCLRELGEPFTHIHQWLDELFKYSGLNHRRYRHNRKGIEEVRKRWGNKASKAAKIHIERHEEGLP